MALGRNTQALELLFTYGTLTDDATYVRVTAHTPSAPIPARLDGWRRFEIPNVSYPGAVAVKYASSIAGSVRSVSTAEEWAALDEYEGVEYSRVRCTVQAQSGPVSAYVYEFDCRASLHLDETSSLMPFVMRFSSSRDDSICSGTRTFLAMLHGAPIGAAEIETQREASDATTWLNEIYVVPELRRLGFGRAIAELLLERLRDEGIKNVSVATRSAKPFLTELGCIPPAR